MGEREAYPGTVEPGGIEASSGQGQVDDQRQDGRLYDAAQASAEPASRAKRKIPKAFGGLLKRPRWASGGSDHQKQSPVTTFDFLTENVSRNAGHGRKPGFTLGALFPSPSSSQGFLWQGFGFAIGIAGYFLLPEEPNLWGVLALWVFLVVLLLRKLLLAKRQGGQIGVLLLAAFLGTSGIACAALRSHLVQAPRLDAPISAGFLANVMEREPTARGLRLLLFVTDVLDRKGQVIAPDVIRSGNLKSLRGMLVRVSLRGKLLGVEGEPLSYLPGDRVRLRARLSPPSGPIHPGGYDFSFWAYFSGIGASGFSFGAPEEMGRLPDLSWKLQLRRWLAQARHHLAERLRRLSRSFQGEPGDGGTSSGSRSRAQELVVALLVGDRSGLDEDVEERLRQSGLAHILAISGLHMALFAGGAYAGLSLLLSLSPWVSLQFPSHKIAACAGLVAACLYLALSGASVPTQRSFLMVGLVLLARLTDRRGLTLHSVALAGGVLLVSAPERLFAPGFQMSFAAVICLVAVYEAWRRLSAKGASRQGPFRGHGSSVIRAVHWAAGFVLATLVTSLVAGLATGLVGAFHFGRVAPFGLLGNLLAMPVFSLIVMPLGGLTLLALPFGLAALPLAGMLAGLELLLLIAKWVAGLGGGGAEGSLAGAVLPPGALVALCWVGGLFLLLVLSGFYRVWGFVPVVLGTVLYLEARPPDLQISADGRIIALRDEGGRLATSTGRPGFLTDAWFVVEGEGGAFRSIADNRMRCDRSGCIYAAADGQGSDLGLNIAMNGDPDGLMEDCALADILVTRSLAPAGCSAGMVFDAANLGRGGAVSLRFSRRPLHGFFPFVPGQRAAAQGSCVDDQIVGDLIGSAIGGELLNVRSDVYVRIDWALPRLDRPWVVRRQEAVRQARQRDIHARASVMSPAATAFVSGNSCGPE